MNTFTPLSRLLLLLVAVGSNSVVAASSLRSGYQTAVGASRRILQDDSSTSAIVAPAEAPFPTSAPVIIDFWPTPPSAEPLPGTDQTFDDKTFCFSAANSVTVQGKGTILMDELRIGDYAKTADGSFSRVYSFSHLDVQSQATYLQFHAQGLEKPLEISRNHILYVGGSTVRARDVKLGDLLGNNITVHTIATVKRTGLYAPVTTSGDIVVSGVVASCFVAILEEIPAPIQRVAAQVALAPLRLACAVNFEICQHETYTAGFSDYGIIQLVQTARQFPAAIKLGATLVASPYVVAASLLQQAGIFPLLAATLFMFGLLFRQASGKARSKAV